VRVLAELAALTIRVDELEKRNGKLEKDE